MKQILVVSPLTALEVAKMAEAEKQLGVSRAVYENRQREYIAALQELKMRYDKDFQKNSKQAINKYSAIVKDGCIVIGLE